MLITACLKTFLNRGSFIFENKVPRVESRPCLVANDAADTNTNEEQLSQHDIEKELRQ